jgi:hypothetical protein
MSSVEGLCTGLHQYAVVYLRAACAGGAGDRGGCGEGAGSCYAVSDILSPVVSFIFEGVMLIIYRSIVSNCTQYELVGSGSKYNVENIVASNNITMDEFLAWNQHVDKTNPIAWVGITLGRSASMVPCSHSW